MKKRKVERKQKIKRKQKKDRRKERNETEENSGKKMKTKIEKKGKKYKIRGMSGTLK